MADWLQGPYFYQVYASKTFGAATGNAMTWVSRLFLTGFASTALFGPLVGRLCDTYGRKAGTLVFSLLYSLGAMSTKSNVLGVLLAGRVMGGIGTSLLFSAPEAWLVGDAARTGVESSLGETFGLAYAGDSIVAILAGQMAGMAAGSRGPSGPFELSVGFLILGGLLASFMWKENVAGGTNSNGGDEEKGDNDSGSSSSSKPTIRDAVKVVKEDPKIMLVGSIQSLFEAAMYVFVLNWPPAVSKAVSAYFSKFATDSSAAISTPYGTVFSCFMACCLLGSTIFGQLTSSTKVDKNGKSKAISTENFAAGMLGLATLAMGCATVSISTSTPRILSTLTSLPVLSTILSPLTALAGSLSSLFSTPGSLLGILILSLFIFESCVGMYFPTIGTLRSKYFPDSHRSVVMNLFGIPLNAMVVTVFLSIEKLGVQGALGVSTTALALATACGLKLKGMVKKEEAE
jgi:MFS family permease